jgi:hypothetical protein
MRRTGLLLCLVGLAGSLAGCSAGEAKRAQGLLQQAQVAEQSVRSEGFVIQIGFDAQGHSGGFAMEGGAELKGAGAGDFYVSGAPTGELATSAARFSFTAMRRGSTISVKTAAGMRTMPLPQAQSRLGTHISDPAQFLNIARYVKSVSVDSTTLDGKPVDRILGKIDTSKLVGSLGGLANNGLAKQLLERARLHLGDIRTVVFVARDTHLLQVMLADMDITAGGKTAHIHLSIALNRVNQPVAFPSL